MAECRYPWLVDGWRRTGITAADLVVPPTVSYWIARRIRRGERTPSIVVLRRLARERPIALLSSLAVWPHGPRARAALLLAECDECVALYDRLLSLAELQPGEAQRL